MKPKTTLRNLLALAGSSLLAMSSSHAATLFFDGSDTGTPNGASNYAGNTSGTPHIWDNSTANWDNGSGYVAWNNGDDANIRTSAGSNKYIRLDNSVTVGALTWPTSGGTTFLQTANSSSLTVNGGIIFGNPAGVQLQVPVTLGGAQTWSMGGTNSSGKIINGGTNLNGHTLTWNTTGTSTNTSAHPAHSGITGSGSLVKDGVGYVRLQGTNDYTGTTTVNGGAVLVEGLLTSSTVTVSGGAIGGTGTITNSLSIDAGSFYISNLNSALAVLGTIDIYAGFGVADLVNIDFSSVALGTYTLIDGTLGAGVFASLDNNSLATAYDTGEGTFAYFQEGSLDLVVTDVIPEPSAALLGSLGVLALLRRRR